MTTQTKRLTREAILNAEDRATEDVDVPEWGGTLTVRSLSGTERDRYEASKVRWARTTQGAFQINAIDLDNVTAQLVASTVIDPDTGANLFTAADVLVLGQKSSLALDRVAKVAQRLSGLTDKDVEDLKAELGKDPSAVSGSA